MFSKSEENYLKSIFSLKQKTNNAISTNDIAKNINISPSSVSDMLKKLEKKDLITYTKYKGVDLTSKGYLQAKIILRKHRLWETFLVKKLDFSWHEVHEIAEQLEHIKSDKLINKIDEFLDLPKYDPHGEPIPSKEGMIPSKNYSVLADSEIGCKATIMGVNNDDSLFLIYLDEVGINIGNKIEIIKKINFDNSIEIKINQKKLHITEQVAKHLLIKKH